jgi:flagellar biosynthesis chaperone FliJ
VEGNINGVLYQLSFNYYAKYALRKNSRKSGRTVNECTKYADGINLLDDNINDKQNNRDSFLHNLSRKIT